jgi:ABC-type glutathione transport system ATPase component
MKYVCVTSQRFKALKKNSMAEATGGRTNGSNRQNARKKSKRQSMIRKPSVAFRLASANDGGSVASGTILGNNNQSLMLVSKGDFTEHYPQLLLEVTVDEADFLDDEEGQEEILGVDISFKDLSLAVNVSGHPFNVVDHVTGRIRGKTMTALMGGSGAGKCGLLGRNYEVDIMLFTICIALQVKRPS